MTASKASEFKAALFTACQGLYATPILVCYGHPGPSSAPDIVAVMGVTSEQEVATMSTNRTREETLRADVVFSVMRGGSDQQTTSERAYYLLGLLEAYLQDAGVASSTQITLGGAVRDCRVTSHELEEAVDPDVLARGRVAEIRATVQARVRI